MNHVFWCVRAVIFSHGIERLFMTIWVCACHQNFFVSFPVNKTNMCGRRENPSPCCCCPLVSRCHSSNSQMKQCFCCCCFFFFILNINWRINTSIKKHKQTPFIFFMERKCTKCSNSCQKHSKREQLHYKSIPNVSKQLQFLFQYMCHFL